MNSKTRRHLLNVSTILCFVLLFAGLFLAAPDGDPDGQVLLGDAELLERKR